MTTTDQIKELRDRLETLDQCLNMSGRRAEVARQTEKTLAPDIGNDPK